MLFLICFSAFNTEYMDSFKHKLDLNLKEYLDEYQNSKVFIDLNQETYCTDEAVWFKVWKTKLFDFKPDTLNEILYIELYSPKKYISQSLILHLKDGTAHGKIQLHDSLVSGIYEIRAYTSWMKNFDSNFGFSKQIEIYNTNTGITRQDFKQTKKTGKKVRKKQNKYTIAFLPEGGELIAGIKTKIAFKATDLNGLPVNVKGEILDSKGNIVSNFKSQHDGMGYFYLKAKPSLKYLAKVRFPENEKKTIKLPEGRREGYYLTINNVTHPEFSVKIFSSIDNQNVLLVARTGTHLIAKEISNIKDSIEVKFNKKEFNDGIATFTLFNANNEPVNERLLFVDNQKRLNVDIGQIELINDIDSIYGTEISIKSPDGKPATGNFSIKIINQDNADKPASRCGITSYLLLSSDIKGYVHNPDYYFSGTKDAIENRDLVMLTNGWRRFTWKNILSRNFPEIKYQQETQMDLYGKITKYFFDIPVSECNVRLTILNEYNDIFETVTDKKGRFSFKNLNYSDTIDVLLEAWKQNGRKNIMIIVDESEAFLMDYMPRFALSEEKLRRLKANRVFYVKPNEAKGEPKKAIEDFKIYSEADNVVKVDARKQYSSVLEALRGQVPGVQVKGSGYGSYVRMRGPTSLMLNQEPLYLIDGIPVDRQAVNSLNPHDVDRIEVLKSPSKSAIYGSRGANGVVAVYTKKGYLMKRGELRFKMLGFHKSREYYHPYGDSLSVVKSRQAPPATVYWHGNFRPGKDGHDTIIIGNINNLSNLSIEINGISNSGLTGSKVLLTN